MEQRYLDEFVRLSCAPDLLHTYLFPNAKEITESFACYDAVREHIWGKVSPRDDKVIFFAVGDGHEPRTAATFAMRSRWTCISIDPDLSMGDKGHLTPHNKINRLYMIRDFVENIPDDIVPNLRDRVVVIGLVHSHAKINDAFNKLHGRETYVVSIPCCVSHAELNGKKPDIEYNDDGIWSPKNTVKIWAAL
jgi:hypothetical protein